MWQHEMRVSFQAGLKLKLQKFLRLWQQVRCNRSCGNRSVLEATLQFGQTVYSINQHSHEMRKTGNFVLPIIVFVGGCSWSRKLFFLGVGDQCLNRLATAIRAWIIYFLSSFFLYILRIDLAFLKTNNGRFHQRACGGTS